MDKKRKNLYNIHKPRHQTNALHFLWQHKAPALSTENPHLSWLCRDKSPGTHIAKQKQGCSLTSVKTKASNCTPTTVHHINAVTYLLLIMLLYFLFPGVFRSLPLPYEVPSPIHVYKNVAQNRSKAPHMLKGPHTCGAS